MKELRQAAKRRVELRPIGSWIKSIVRHFYYCLQSVPLEQQDRHVVIIGKWLSVVSHIRGNHENCEHAELSNEGDRAYIRSGPAVDTLEKIVKADKRLKILHRIEPRFSTSHLEGHNATINTFARKNNAYRAPSYVARFV